jgi:hypothetical protein
MKVNSLRGAYAPISSNGISKDLLVVIECLLEMSLNDFRALSELSIRNLRIIRDNLRRKNDT